MYFTKTFSEEHPEVVRQILSAEVRALKWLRSSRSNLLLASRWSLQAGKALTKRKTMLTVEQGAYLAISDIIGSSSAPLIPRRDLSLEGPLRAEFQLLQAIGKIPSAVGWEAVYNSFDLEIMSDVLTNSRNYNINKNNYRIE